MALLSAFVAMAAPSLSRFFKGRSVIEEARRFLALTRYAQNQAVSLAIPLEVWNDPRERRYGVAPAPGYEVEPEMELYYVYDESTRVEPVALRSGNPLGNILVFLPDGTIDEASVFGLAISRADDETVYYVVQNEWRTGFEILDHTEYLDARNRQSFSLPIR